MAFGASGNYLDGVAVVGELERLGRGVVAVAPLRQAEDDGHQVLAALGQPVFVAAALARFLVLRLGQYPDVDQRLQASGGCRRRAGSSRCSSARSSSCRVRRIRRS